MFAPALAQAQHPANITGIVRDGSGTPQVGALVELLAPNLTAIAHTFTDDHGRYTLPGVTPGLYEVKASGSLLLPTLRENLHLVANAHLVVNLTLNTLYQAFQWLPAQPRAVDEPRDDWNWTLRLSTNRPLLRVLDDPAAPTGAVVLVSEGPDTHSAGQSHVTLRGGANRFGDGGFHQAVEVLRDHDDARQLILRADVGDLESTALRSTAAYLRQLGPGTAVISVASFSDHPQVSSGAGRDLSSATFRTAVTLAPVPGFTLEAGNEFEAVHLSSSEADTLAISHPFVSAAVHSGDYTVTYRMATSPDVQSAEELDSEATLTPRVSEQDGQLRLAGGRHQALELTRHTARRSAGLSAFHDSIADPVVSGGIAITGGNPGVLPLFRNALMGSTATGASPRSTNHLALAAADAASGNLLYDPATDLIAVTGGSYVADGLLAFVREQVGPTSWIALRAAVGRAIAMREAEEANESLAAGLDSLRSVRATMLSAEVGTTLRRTGTDVRASYRWQPASTLTSVAPFDNATPPPFLGVHIRQPLHNKRLQAIVDMRNLLAEGYRPFLSDDGSVLYFAQAPRCIEAGLSFTF